MIQSYFSPSSSSSSFSCSSSSPSCLSLHNGTLLPLLVAQLSILIYRPEAQTKDIFSLAVFHGSPLTNPLMQLSTIFFSPLCIACNRFHSFRDPTDATTPLMLVVKSQAVPQPTMPPSGQLYSPLPFPTNCLPSNFNPQVDRKQMPASPLLPLHPQPPAPYPLCF